MDVRQYYSKPLLFICLLALLMLLATFSLQPGIAAIETRFCPQLDSNYKLPKHSMPKLWDRDAFFECTGLTDVVAGLDELDRDLLIGRAVNSEAVKLFVKHQTKTDPPVKYSDLSDELILEGFYTFVQSLK